MLISMAIGGVNRLKTKRANKGMAKSTRKFIFSNFHVHEKRTNNCMTKKILVGDRGSDPSLGVRLNPPMLGHTGAMTTLEA